MENRSPSWWHFLWIIPSVIITEALAVLGMMKHDGKKQGKKNDTDRPSD